MPPSATTSSAPCLRSIASCRLAEAEPAVFGARLTGGGFGGSIVALVRAGEAAGVASRVAAAYGAGATVLVP